MFMSIILIPADNYQHRHVLRHGGAGSGAAADKAVRDAIALINPDVKVLHVEPDVTPDFVTATVAAIREEDPGHDPLHPADLTARDPAKVKAEQEVAADKARPLARDALARAREVHARIQSEATPPAPKPAAAPVPAAPAAPAHPVAPKPA